LAAFGLAWLIGLAPEKWPKEWKLAKVLVVGLLGLIGGIVCFDHVYPATNASDYRVLANGCVRGLFLLAGVACVPFLRESGNRKRQRLAQLGLLLLAWLDVLTHAPDLCPTVFAANWEPDAIRQVFKWDSQMSAGTSRAMRSKRTFWKMLLNGFTDPDVDLEGRRLSLFMNLNLVDHVAKFDGFYSLEVKEYLDVFKHVYFTTNEAGGLLDFLGISEMGNPANVLAWIARDTYRPLITIGSAPVCLNAKDTLEAIFADTFAPSQTVYLPVEAGGLVQAKRSTNAQILSPRFLARRLDFGVQSDAAAVVVVAQTYYSAWHAYVDGKSAPLWRANYAFQSVEVPPGKHQVSLIYEDRPFYWGALISLIALLSCGGAWLWFRMQRKQVGRGEGSLDGPSRRL
jgi:hypothetical protein